MIVIAGLRDKAFTDEDMDRLKSLGADVHRTNRGGLATFHGPGQLVAYPIINLKKHSIGLREWVEALLYLSLNNIPTMQFWTGIPRNTLSNFVELEIPKQCIMGYSLAYAINSYCTVPVNRFSSIRSTAFGKTCTGNCNDLWIRQRQKMSRISFAWKRPATWYLFC